MAPPVTTMSPPELMAAALLTVKNRSPWMFGTLLFLKRTWAPGKNTIGVTESGRLLADPQMISNIGNEQDGVEKIATLLEHEFMHLVLKHVKRGKALGLSAPEDLDRWNKAGDLAINPLLRDQNRKFPDQYPPLMPESYGFEVGLTAEGYYSRLKEDEEKNGKPPPGQGSCGGHCCSQHEETGEGDGQDSDPSGPPLPTPPQMDQKMAEAQAGMKEAMQKHRGQGSAGILRTLDELLAPPKVRWDEKLRRLVSYYGEHKPGAQHPTFNRMSKKQGGLGYGPGTARMPTYYACPVKVGVVLDTSGSMGSAEMGQILPEAESIIKHARGEIVFLACDAEVNAMVKVRNTKDLIANAKGGGGTSFAPALRAIEAMPEKKRPKLVVYFTDGYGDNPPEPTGFKVIWCLTGGATSCSASWGEVVRIEDE